MRPTSALLVCHGRGKLLLKPNKKPRVPDKKSLTNFYMSAALLTFITRYKNRWQHSEYSIKKEGTVQPWDREVASLSLTPCEINKLSPTTKDEMHITLFDFGVCSPQGNKTGCIFMSFF